MLASPLFLAGLIMAGLLSSGHCSMMCGPIAMIFKQRYVIYQTGRVIGYTLVGLALGSIGYSLDQAGLLISLQNSSLYIAILSIAIYGLMQLPGLKRKKINVNSWLYRPGQWIVAIQKSRRWPAAVVVLVAGMLTALIPCHILYPVWALTAGSGSPIQGALISFAFVIGTLPALTGIQLLSGEAMRRGIFAHRGMQRAASMVIFLSGVLLLFYRSNHGGRFDFSQAGQSSSDQCESTPDPSNIGNQPQ